MLKQCVIGLLEALELPLAFVRAPWHEGIEDLLSEQPSQPLTHECFWTLVARLRRAMDLRRDEATKLHKVFHVPYRTPRKSAKIFLGWRKRLRLDPQAILTYFTGTVSEKHPVVFDEMETEIRRFVAAVGFKSKHLWAKKGQVSKIPDEVLAETGRTRGGISDLFSDSPVHPLTNETFQALLGRLQAFLNAATHEAGKHRKPLKEAFPALSEVSILTDDGFHIDPAKVLRLYKGSFSKDGPPVPAGLLPNPSAPRRAPGPARADTAAPKPADPSEPAELPASTASLAPPPAEMAISIPDLAEALSRLLRDDDIRQGRSPGSQENYARLVLRVLVFLLQLGVRPLQLQEGCLEIWVNLTGQQLAALRDALERDPLLRGAGILIHERGLFAKPGAVQAFLNAPLPADRTDPDLEKKADRFLSRALKIESFLRHWTRLRWIFSPRIRLSPMASALSASGERYYGAIARSVRWKSIAGDWVGTLLCWPLVVAFLAIVVAGLLQLLVLPAPVAAVLWSALPLGITCGLFLGCVGAQPCSCVLGVVPCGAGAIPMGLAFGLASSFVLALRLDAGLALQAITDDPFTAVTGGVVGLSAPGWLRAFHSAGIPGSPFFIAGLILAMWLAIVASGWLMAQPRRASPIFKNLAQRPASSSFPEAAVTGRARSWFQALRERLVLPRSSGRKGVLLRRGWWRALLAAIVGGSGIGLTLGFTHLLLAAGCSATAAFTASFAVVGGSASAAGVRYRTGSSRRAGAFFVIHALLAGALCFATFHMDGFACRVVVLSATCGFFHSTWFTASYILGEWLGGPEHSETIAVSSAAVESLGFIILVLVKLFSGGPL